MNEKKADRNGKEIYNKGREANTPKRRQKSVRLASILSYNIYSSKYNLGLYK